MTLFLYEITPSPEQQADPADLVDAIAASLTASGAEVIETQVTKGAARLFTIVELPDGPDGACSIETPALDAAAIGAVDVTEPAQVRLVGTDLETIKAARPEAGYLVEWDIPAEVDMETYLSRKKEKSPKYAEIPEVSFLRTYVREDTDKCLCFYNAPDTDAVVRAREIVSTPISRLHELA
ncbi:DUF4242 domain-containing protein [Rhodococcus sp. IEGM 1408]|uniref:DUF4242 domain-containing protein n=1 Tax=Rhodococcus sp. IEGM 1408 TaxID=3082220 RepID=UPI00295484A3|nr:DUF4242 domain-containing protein [Rhodococcus sp. IEGM 1408]MDV8000643.1 DUF4242 domain-containing protein [Rhodococcus sp. IEGM 1408]